MTKRLYCNIFKSIKTTIIGLLIICISIYSLFIKDSLSWSDIIVPILIGIVLILSPDSIVQIIKQYLKKDEIK
jgi:hypothetical protein